MNLKNLTYTKVWKCVKIFFLRKDGLNIINTCVFGVLLALILMIFILSADGANWAMVIVTTLSFFTFVAALFMQRKELEMQRKELSNNTFELGRHSKEFKQINEYNRKQERISTYALLLENTRNNIELVTYTNLGEVVKGCIAHSRIKDDIYYGTDIMLSTKVYGIDATIKAIIICGKYIKTAIPNESKKEKNTFFEMLNSILSSDVQLILIWYFAQSESNDSKFFYEYPTTNLFANIHLIIKVYELLLDTHFKLTDLTIDNTTPLLKILKFYKLEDLRRAFPYEKISCGNNVLMKLAQIITKEKPLNPQQKYLLSIFDKALINQFIQNKCTNIGYIAGVLDSIYNSEPPTQINSNRK